MMEHTCTNKILSLCEQQRLYKSVDFGSFQDILESPHCQICRMLVHIVAQYQGTAHPLTHTKDGSKIQCCIYYGYSEVVDLTKLEIYNFYLALNPCTPDSMVHGWESKKYEFSLKIGRQEFSIATDPSVRIFKRKHSTNDGTINPSFLASWIEGFKRNHGSKCASSIKTEIPRHPRYFKLIDVKAMKICQAPRNARYAALSYVWGADCEQFEATIANQQLLKEDQSLSRIKEQIPRTIRDAITLLQRLEWQYLWVDSLCIVQDSQHDKMEQVSAMHTIFEEAELVLAAAYGNNANAGLPGVEPYRFPLRAVRATECIHEKFQLLSGSVLLSDALPTTYWYSRGWTFQESRLASMQLIFTASQAYLLCGCGKLSMEQVALDAFHFSNNDCQSVSTALKACEYPILRNHDHDLETEYTGLLAEYTIRDLSFPRDILNAFSAILTNLERKWSTKFVFGLPESNFAFFLQWTYGNKIRRRDCTIYIQRDNLAIGCPVPSWSWAGWIGQVRRPHRLEISNYNEVLEIKWNLSDHNVPLNCGDPIRYTLIQASAPTAYFNIGAMQRDFVHGDAHPILSSSGKQVGFVKIPSCQYWTAGDSGQSRCEFIALSAGPCPSFFKDGKYHFDSEAPQIVVGTMFVGGRRNGIVFRIGIANISWEDWLDENPVEQFVTLG